ncbi:MAG: EAL domain-containing protein [Prochlorothrix sp.]|nr:EAL domain-containing protein [Prochlorothrix sp.]
MNQQSLPQTLSRQLLSALTLAFVLIWGSILVSSYTWVQSHWEQKAQMRAQEMLNGLAQVVQSEPAPTLSWLQVLVNNYGALPNIREVAVVDRDCTLLLSTEAISPSAAPPLPSLPTYTQQHPKLCDTLQTLGYQSFHTSAPLLLPLVSSPLRPQPQGLSLRIRERGQLNPVQIITLQLPETMAVAVRRPVFALAMINLRHVHQEIRQSFIQVVVGIGVAVGLLLGVMWLLLRQIVLKPLERLQGAILQLRETNSFEVEPIVPAAEIFVLTTTFAEVFAQRMRIELALRASEERERHRAKELTEALAQLEERGCELEERSQELEEAKALLEERVAQRTAELSQTLQNLQQTQSQLLAQEEQLRHDALHDRLTGLPNREYLMRRLDQAIARTLQKTEGQPYCYAVLFIDLDHFKVVNDSLGHLVGDELLKRVSDRLSHALREEDILARLGGDEFVILLDNIHSPTYAIQVADRLQQRLQKPFQLQNHEVFTGASIGITDNTAGYQRPEEILRDADIAMYNAKRSGKGCHTLFNADMQAQALDRLQLETEFRRGLSQQEFCLYYQPILDLQTTTIVAVEALVRWDHPQRGLLLPNAFIALAEETGLIRELGRWILHQACGQVATWRQQFPHCPLTLHLNLSPTQLHQDNLAHHISFALASSQLPGSYLQLELAEHLLLTTNAQLAQTMGQVQDLGVQLCVDDFGMGHSSLQTLQMLRIDTLKIDRTFIQGLSQHHPDRGMVPTIIALAHSNQMTVIAEGVETEQQLLGLRELDCDLGQGVLFAAPLNRSALTEYLSKTVPSPVDSVPA